MIVFEKKGHLYEKWGQTRLIFLLETAACGWHDLKN